MPRTNATLVKAILGDDYDGVTDLTPFLDTATVIVSNVKRVADTYPLPLDSSELELIERWVAAHCYSTPNRPFQSAKTGDASAAFQGRTAMYLDATYYGQMAISTDRTGILKAISSGKRISVRLQWLGLPPSEQTSFDQRD